MFKKVFYVSVIAFVIFVIIGFMLPRHVHVERSITIDRPASTVFILLNGYQTFQIWSPWAARDPDATYRLSGPDSGVGARLEWEGDPRLVGSGWQEITESVPYSLVRMHLDFEQQGRAEVYFRIDEQSGGVLLTWGFDTDLVEGQGLFGGILARYFGLFFDRWIGSDYESGLARLKTFAESLPATDFTGLEVAVVDAQPFDILYIAVDPEQGNDDIAASLAGAYREITALMHEQGIEMAAQPMAITRGWDASGYAFDAAIPVILAEGLQPSGRIRAGRSPAGQAVRVVHRGPYDRMAASYEKLAAYMAAHGLVEGRVSWEHYISDPTRTAPDRLVTHIYFLVEDEEAGS